jgi:hypothetical protein
MVQVTKKGDKIYKVLRFLTFFPLKLSFWSCPMFFVVNFIAVQIEYYFGVKYILLGRVRLSSKFSVSFGVVHDSHEDHQRRTLLKRPCETDSPVVTAPVMCVLVYLTRKIDI